MKTNRYDKATDAYNTALLYSSKPDYLIDNAICCKQTGKLNEAIQSLKLVATMKPCNLRSRFMLMHLYADKNSTNGATLMAREIMRVPVKVQSAESKYYQSQAARYLNCPQPSKGGS